MDDTVDASVRRGSAEVLILSMIEDRARHGYEIARLIEQQSHGAVRFHVASFYPLLYQLERRGLIRGTLDREVRPAAPAVLPHHAPRADASWRSALAMGRVHRGDHGTRPFATSVKRANAP